jgi:hypothetical protein
MQNLELLLLILTFGYLLFSRKIYTKVKKPIILSYLTLFFVLHLIFNGYRWQMIPAYLLWSIAIFSALRNSTKVRKPIINVLRITGLLLLAGISFILPTILPVFELPKTTGKFSVGTTNILLETNKEEIITSDPNDERTMMIKVWYPTNDIEGNEDLYIDKGGRYGFAQKYGLPSSTFNYLDKIETHVWKNATIPDESFPILIFSHGYHSKANGYYSLLSEIASQGYIVFGINHTYESTGTTFLDGETRFFDNEYSTKILENTWHIIEPSMNAFQTAQTFEERHPVIKQSLQNYFVKDIIERWADDIQSVSEELQNWNNKGFFKNKLNLHQVGVFGHSRGGAAAGEILLGENNIKAGINLDGVQWGQMVDTCFQKPFLYLSSDWPENHPNYNKHAYINESKSDFYEGIIKNSGHSNFMDIPFMIPINSINEAGTIDPNVAINIASDVVVSFFNKYLKNQNIDINSLNSKHKELTLSLR